MNPLSQTSQPLVERLVLIMGFESILVVWSLGLAVNAGFFVYLLRLLLKSRAESPEKKVDPQAAGAIALAGLTFLLMLGFGVNELFVRPPEVVEIRGVVNGVWQKTNTPLEVIFDRPVVAENLSLDLTPSTEAVGTWTYAPEASLLRTVRRVVFTPEYTSVPDTEFQLYITGRKNIWGGGEGGDLLYSFKTPSYLAPSGIYPGPAAEEVNVKSPISIGFAADQSEFLDLAVQLTPPTAGTSSWNNGNFFFTPTSSLLPATTYRLQVFRQFVKRNAVTGIITTAADPVAVSDHEFTTAAPFNIASYQPSTREASLGSDIVINFTTPPIRSDVEAKFRLEPSAATGRSSWPDDKTFVYDPAGNLQPGKDYKIILEAGVRTLNGDVSSVAIELEFATIGAATVTSTSPRDKSQGVAIERELEVSFNQAVDKLSAQQAFSLHPSTAGSFRWRGNTMIFKPHNPLSYNTTYTLKIASGVKVITGLNSTSEFSIQFTTVEDKIELAVPLVKQDLRFECNITAATMVLNYYGVQVTKEQFYEKISKQSVPYDSADNIWGDPNEGFVGDIRGNDRGYGVHWDPVAKVINRYRSSEVHRNWNLTDLLSEVKAGHPVIVWWQNGRSTPDDISWTTPDDEEIKAVNGMHSEVVVGYVGTAEKPQRILVNDPWRGKRELTVEQFTSLWQFYDETALVVR
jgi:uncharacterized protein YvpB